MNNSATYEYGNQSESPKAVLAMTGMEFACHRWRALTQAGLTGILLISSNTHTTEMMIIYSFASVATEAMASKRLQ